MRVIAGSLKSRALAAPPGQRTRPTAARAREALFSMLGELAGARVLDLYAGSGALGIEALSRGAEHATFVEQDRAALECLRENLARLELEARATVVGAAVERSARRIGEIGPFDLVLCDPPWPALERALVSLARGVLPALAPGARLVVEHPAALAPELAPLAATRRRHWGDTGVTFFEAVSVPVVTDAGVEPPARQV